jgi:pyridoxamine 5'-phosphate oxidase-like protein
MATTTMARQGDLALLDDPVAKELLVSKMPARLAYNWTDGTPRVVPVWFHWNGTEFALAGPSEAPKMKALHDGDRVALTIDSDTFPYHVLSVRGQVKVSVVKGVPPDYTAACRRYFGDEMGEGWSAQMAEKFATFGQILVKPDWVGIVDFERRFPSAFE